MKSDDRTLAQTMDDEFWGPADAEGSKSAEFTGSVADVSEKMLTSAMRKAVALGIFPKHVGQYQYLQNWSSMKEVLEAALLSRD